MKPRRHRSKAFTLIELLVVMAIIAILAALAFPVTENTKNRTRVLVCQNNLKQINLAVRMYSDDSNDASPTTDTASARTNIATLYSGYKKLIESYVGKNSSQRSLFTCPADRFYPNYLSKAATNVPYVYVQQSLHDSPLLDYSSYAFNGGDNQIRSSEVGPWTPPGLTGLKLSAVKHPSRTILVTEASALIPWSWHKPAPQDGALPYTDAKNVVSFVDGHVSVVRIYWNSTRYPNGGISFAFAYDPPTEYDYQWSGN